MIRPIVFAPRLKVGDSVIACNTVATIDRQHEVNPLLFHIEFPPTSDKQPYGNWFHADYLQKAASDN